MNGSVRASDKLPFMRKGVCIWFTGLSGSGKTTTAMTLRKLLEQMGRVVTLLDGDLVRNHLSAGLGFSKADRNTHLLRVAFVAGEIVRHGGIVICATISPYREVREACCRCVGRGQFVEVYVDTPLQVCRNRDPKGLYAKASRGEARQVTGIDDPYEAPEHPDLILDTIGHTAEENVRQILALMRQSRFLD